MTTKTAIRLVTEEFERATARHGVFNSCHEGFAVLKEEVDELWDEVKANNGSTHRGATEAVQAAAMAIRYLVDMCPESTAVEHDEKANPRPKPGRAYSSYGYSG